MHQGTDTNFRYLSTQGLNKIFRANRSHIYKVDDLEVSQKRTRSQSIDELTKSADSSPLVEIRSKKRNQERITIIL